MDLQDHMMKIEETMAGLTINQQEMLGHIIERMEGQFSQHIFGKNKDDCEYSATQGQWSN